jgi:hypothetical protein
MFTVLVTLSNGLVLGLYKNHGTFKEVLAIGREDENGNSVMFLGPATKRQISELKEHLTRLEVHCA